MGKIVNNYELLEQLGQGGMGVVYKARHIHFKEIVAIKRLWEQFSNDQTVLELFLNEGITLRRLHHQNIVQVSDLFEFEGSHYIVMEYIEGRTLSEIIKKETGPIYRERAINLFIQMLEGVAYIHNQPKPIIHRDIKPLNILITEDDTVKITDFGIAKALDDGQNASTVMKGTPVYMSPEQIINPKTVDIRTDVYSLGMTFYEMLCGKNPFSGYSNTSPTAVYAAIVNGNVRPPTEFYRGITDALSGFVMKAIHKDRNERFANVEEMLEELKWLDKSGQTIPETKPPKPSPTPEPVNKPSPPSEKPDDKIQKPIWIRDLRWGFFALIVIMIFGAVGASLWNAIKPDKRQERDSIINDGGSIEASKTTEPKANADDAIPKTAQPVEEVKNTVDINPAYATANSTFPSSFGLSYSPSNAIDYDLSTWWSPNSPYHWIKFIFNTPTKIHAIKILNGSHYLNFTYQGVSYGDLYTKNAIITRAILEFSDGTRVTVNFEIYDGMQTVEFPEVTTTFVKLTPVDFHHGSEWPEVCISEVKFL